MAQQVGQHHTMFGGKERSDYAEVQGRTTEPVQAHDDVVARSQFGEPDRQPLADDHARRGTDWPCGVDPRHRLFAGSSSGVTASCSTMAIVLSYLRLSRGDATTTIPFGMLAWRLVSLPVRLLPDLQMYSCLAGLSASGARRAGCCGARVVVASSGWPGGRKPWSEVLPPAGRSGVRSAGQTDGRGASAGPSVGRQAPCGSCLCWSSEQGEQLVERDGDRD